MTRIPDLWWSPTHGLIKREDGMCWLMTNGPLLEDGEALLPADAIRLDRDRGTDYIRVGERISTEDRHDTYVLCSGPQTMYLEPVDTGEGHVIELLESEWTIKHPVTCRRDIFACPYNEAAKMFPLFHRGRLGRFRCLLAEDGALVLGEEIS